MVSGIGTIGAAGPLPNVAEELRDTFRRRGGRGMQSAVAQEVAGDGNRSGGTFPFGFGGEARSSPPRICLRLVKTQVANRFCRIHLSHTQEGHGLPICLAALP